MNLRSYNQNLYILHQIALISNQFSIMKKWTTRFHFVQNGSKDRKSMLNNNIYQGG